MSFTFECVVAINKMLVALGNQVKCSCRCPALVRLRSAHHPCACSGSHGVCSTPASDGVVYPLSHTSRGPEILQFNDKLPYPVRCDGAAAQFRLRSRAWARSFPLTVTVTTTDNRSYNNHTIKPP